MHRNGDRVGKHGKGAAISGGERAFAWTQTDRQLTLRLAATSERPGV